MNTTQRRDQSKIQAADRRAPAAAMLPRTASLRMRLKLVILLAAALTTVAMTALGAAKFVSGCVPDWNQPYDYTSPNGPGPDPAANVPNQWNDWCVPTSAANLAGYWSDYGGLPVADTTAYPNSTVAWGAGPSWQDYLADSNRPPQQAFAQPLPSPVTDIGWYLDTNRGVNYDGGVAKLMGGYFFGDNNHNGTRLKNTHVGLQYFLNSRYSLSGGVFWKTGTEGVGYAAGVDPAGQAAQQLPNTVSGFAEIVSEINTDHPLILWFTYWDPVATAHTIAQTGTSTESQFGGTYYTWGSDPGPTNINGEEWNYYNDGYALGHAVTCVGYIVSNDVDDIYSGTSNATDWVIVHDNWPTTARNVIIPFKAFNAWKAGEWVATTTAVPWPTGAKFVKDLVPDWNQPYQYTAGSAHGGPGPDPMPPRPPLPPTYNQWNDWCAPTAAANLAGHWADYHHAPVADAAAYPGSVRWATAASWQDYLADGFARPAWQIGPAASLPASPTDIGWYMDTNRGEPLDPPAAGNMGGYFFNDPLHAGTYIQNIHVGLQNYLNSRYSVSGAGWLCGTAGRVYAVGCDPTGAVAMPLGDSDSAFNQVKDQINQNHTLLLSYKHWNIAAAGISDLPAVGQSTESDYGGSYYVWGNPPGQFDLNEEDEQWNFGEGSNALSHVVTAVGYIPGGDPLDPSPSLGGLVVGASNDWVIVHDNWASTPRNVIIPYDWPFNWTANTIAVPDPAMLQVTGISLAGGTNAMISFAGLPSMLHHLQWESDLQSNSWATVVSNMAFSAGTMRVTNIVSSSEQKRFYRVKASN